MKTNICVARGNVILIDNGSLTTENHRHRPRPIDHSDLRLRVQPARNRFHTQQVLPAVVRRRSRSHFQKPLPLCSLRATPAIHAGSAPGYPGYFFSPVL